MGAAAHLDLFNRTVAAFDSLSDDDADAYLDGDSGLDTDGRPGGGVPDAVRRWKNSTANSKPCWKPRTSSR